MRFCNIASGSSGNCTYAGDDHTHLIIDAGISGKRIEAGLNELELTTPDMTGILITHEHTDHIGGLGVLARRYGIPIYATGGTIDAIRRMPRYKDIPDHLYHVVKADQAFSLGDFEILPLAVSHDAAEPVAYRLENNGKRASIATDLGTYDEHIVRCMRNSDILMLEANHDVHMLEVGPYPYPVKRRILSDRGHLSNVSAGMLLSRILNDHIKTAYLGHLSRTNNYDALAYATVTTQLAQDRSCAWREGDIPILVARWDQPMDKLEV